MHTLHSTLSTVLLAALLGLADIGIAQENLTPIECGKYYQIQSTVSKERRTLLVRLPDDYEKTDKRYPVLYKLDGEMGNFLEAVSSAYYLFDIAEKAPDFIVVGLKNTDRNRDMFPERGADDFARFIDEELTPYLEKHFRTSGVRILCGQSLSSVFAMDLFLKRPGAFDGYVLSSFGLSGDWLTLFKRDLAEMRPAGKRRVIFYISNGKLDPYDSDGSRTRNGILFMDSLRALNQPALRIKYRVYEDEGHVPFPTLCDALRWIYFPENIGWLAEAQ